MFTKLLHRARGTTPRAAAGRIRTKPGCRPSLEPLEDRCLLSANVVLQWNEILMQSLPGPASRIPLARNMALVHVAMFDAANAIDRSYEPYHADVQASRGASLEAAVAQAAHDTLVALYPGRAEAFGVALTESLTGIPHGRALQGIAVGQEVARQILELRSGDNSSAIVSYTPPNDDAGQWQPTPPDNSAAAAAHVPGITPFALESSAQFRPAPPPDLLSAEYTAAYNEAKALGSATGSVRTDDQTLVAGLWRTPLAIHQVWNRIAQDAAESQNISVVDSARLFALLNMALNDGLQASFESKFHFGLWRPVTAIQHGGIGGPLDNSLDPRADGNPDTIGDPNWLPLHPGTPPYPTYAGNAATIGAALATVMADVFGTNDVPFDIHWDSYGFPGVTRSYAGFWDAAEEVAVSRVYGGIHFTFDSEAGQGIGVNVANFIVDNFLSPWDGRAFQATVPGGAGQSEAAAGISASLVFAGFDLFSRDAFTMPSGSDAGVSQPASPSVVSGAVSVGTSSGVSAGPELPTDSEGTEAATSLDLLWAAVGADLGLPAGAFGDGGLGG